MYAEGLTMITEGIDKLNKLNSLMLNFGFNEVKG